MYSQTTTRSYLYIHVHYIHRLQHNVPFDVYAENAVVKMVAVCFGKIGKTNQREGGHSFIYAALLNKTSSLCGRLLRKCFIYCIMYIYACFEHGVLNEHWNVRLKIRKQMIFIYWKSFNCNSHNFTAKLHRVK